MGKLVHEIPCVSANIDQHLHKTICLAEPECYVFFYRSWTLNFDWTVYRDSVAYSHLYYAGLRLFLYAFQKNVEK